MENGLNCMTCMIGRFKDDLCDVRFCEKCKKIGDTQDVEQALILAGKIVRCKDCKHLYLDADCGLACEYTNMGMREEDYCSYGERIE